MTVPVVATIVPLIAAGNTTVETGELEALFNKAGSLNAGNTGGIRGAAEFPDTAEPLVAVATLAEPDRFVLFVKVNCGTFKLLDVAKV